MHEALADWLDRRRLEEAVRADQAAYDAKPVDQDEFAAVLGAQKWPK